MHTYLLQGTLIQQAEITQLVQAAIGPPEHSVHSASSHTTPPYAPPRVPLLQRRITIPTSYQTPVPGPHPHRPPTYHARLALRGLPSGQTQARGLPLLLLEQSPAVHSPPPVVSARVRLPAQLLARRHAPISVAPSPALCKANQAHPPAAPAALERKHPVDARRQLSQAMERNPQQCAAARRVKIPACCAA